MKTFQILYIVLVSYSEDWLEMMDVYSPSLTDGARRVIEKLAIE